jgi:hypothetical protein
MCTAGFQGSAGGWPAQDCCCAAVSPAAPSCRPCAGSFSPCAGSSSPCHTAARSHACQRAGTGALLLVVAVLSQLPQPLSCAGNCASVGKSIPKGAAACSAAGCSHHAAGIGSSIHTSDARDQPCSGCSSWCHNCITPCAAAAACNAGCATRCCIGSASASAHRYGILISAW